MNRTMLVLGLVAILVTAWMVRYDYDSTKSIRVNRITGVEEVICSYSGGWVKLNDKCEP